MSKKNIFWFIVLALVIVWVSELYNTKNNATNNIKDYQKYVDKSKGKTWEIVTIGKCKYIASCDKKFSDASAQFVYVHCGDCDNPIHKK